jgi:hypothetical protein
MGVRKRSNGTIYLLVHLTLKPGRDDALIELVQNAPRRALAPLVREAMRSGVSSSAANVFQETEEDFSLPDLSLDL